MAKNIRKPTIILAALIFLSLSACVSVQRGTFTASAADFNDKTLIMSANQRMAKGIDIYRYVEGSSTNSYWTLLMPTGCTDYEMRFRIDGQVKVITTKESEYAVKWSDLTGHDKWSTVDDRPYQVIVTCHRPDSISTRLMGIAFVIILKKGVTPEPLNKIQEQTRCEFGYDHYGYSQLTCGDLP